MEFLERVYFDNTVLQWCVAAGVALGTYLAFQVVKFIVVRRLKKVAEVTATDLDDFIVSLLASTKLLLILVLSLYAGSFMLTISESVRDYLTAIAIVASLVQAALWGNKLIDYTMRRFTQDRLAAQDPASTTAAGVIGTVARIVFFTLVVLVGLASVGFDISALVAGLGIGGIAIALAVNGILQDLFGSLSIALDKPFAVGDFITVGEFSGTVEHVGMKSTRVRSNTGEQLVMANGDLLSSRLRNFGRMNERRGNMTLGVTYDTPADKLEAIPDIIREIVDAEPLARFDRAHFASYGDSALHFNVVFWVETPVYMDFMNTTQAINLQIKRRFESECIDFAYPTRTVFIAKDEPCEDEQG